MVTWRYQLGDIYCEVFLIDHDRLYRVVSSAVAVAGLIEKDSEYWMCRPMVTVVVDGCTVPVHIVGIARVGYAMERYYMPDAGGFEVVP